MTEATVTPKGAKGVGKGVAVALLIVGLVVQVARGHTASSCFAGSPSG